MEELMLQMGAVRGTVDMLVSNPAPAAMAASGSNPVEVSSR
jgi:hypothetical protein